jgi:hypothetical protein
MKVILTLTQVKTKFRTDFDQSYVLADCPLPDSKEQPAINGF